MHEVDNDAQKVEPPARAEGSAPEISPSGALSATRDPDGQEAHEAKITILINLKPYHVERTTLAPQDFRDLAGLPGDYEVWRIVKAPDPEGQLPVDDVQVTEPVEVKSGDRFRVVPPGTFGGHA